jgi:hypothetical protein
LNPSTAELIRGRNSPIEGDCEETMRAAALQVYKYSWHDWMRTWIPLALVAASYFIYACAAVIVGQNQQNDFIPERSSIAAAVSNVAYGAPLGKVYAGVLARFLEMDVPLDKTMEQTARQAVPPGALLGSTSDGNGIGYIVLASVGMRLFGLHTSSLVLSMLATMGISALAFLWRFRDPRAVVVILYFTSLTVMLFTPLVWNHAENYPANFGIGGIRYFSLVAILPGFHLLLELDDARGSGSGTVGWELGPIAVQIVVLVLAVLIRNSAAPVIAAIFVGCLLIAWKNRHQSFATKRTLIKVAYMTAVGTMFVGLLLLSISRSYLTEGRFTETLWHRITLSLFLNPNSPYGKVQEIYKCAPYIPEGFENGPSDRNGHCIWWDYATRHNIPPDKAAMMTYGREYDVALREAFFKIAWLYPAETLKTFVYYKLLYIFRSIAQSLDLKVAGVQPALLWLLVAAVGNFLVIVLIFSSTSPSSNIAIARVALLLVLFSMAPYIAVWAKPFTSGDLLLYCFFCLGLAAIAIVEKSRALLLPRSDERHANSLSEYRKP